jgi:hypothetical protein
MLLAAEKVSLHLGRNLRSGPHHLPRKNRNGLHQLPGRNRSSGQGRNRGDRLRLRERTTTVAPETTTATARTGPIRLPQRPLHREPTLRARRRPTTTAMHRPFTNPAVLAERLIRRTSTLPDLPLLRRNPPRATQEYTLARAQFILRAHIHRPSPPLPGQSPPPDV